MKDRLPNLVWIRSFEAAARRNSFTAAAEELGLTQTAVSLHIKSLEARLGGQLFLRRPRHLRLTSAGEAYLTSVAQALGDIRTATTNLFGLAERQLLTVRAPISTAALWLPNRLPAFRALYPNVTVRLVSAIWTRAAPDEEIDVDLRLGPSEEYDGPSEVISEETAVAIVGGARRETVRKPGDLRDQPRIHILGYDDIWTRVFAAHTLDQPAQAPAYSVDTSVSALGLVGAGAGAAAILTRFAQDAITTGAPIAMVGDPIPFVQSHYLARPHSRRAPNPAADLFEDWLKQALAEEAQP